MPATWFIGDLHFGHQKVAEIRGFRSVDQHDLSLFDGWKRRIHDGDTVFVLGDISSGASTGERRALEVLSQLPGAKHLIAGNHDSVSGIHRNGYKQQPAYLKVFDSIRDFGRIRCEGSDLLMSHYPYASQGDGPDRGPMRYAQWRLPDLGGLLIHAHTHNTDAFSGSPTGREMCVSWDAWKRPVNLGDVAQWVKRIH